jgi:hypothetical protein
MDTALLALLGSSLALIISGCHCVYRHGARGDSWFMVYEPVPREQVK